MTLDANILKILHQKAIAAASAAGRYISSNKPANIEHKVAGSSAASQVVTEVDRESQRLILSVLEPTIESYDLGLLAEEEADDGSRLVKDYFWCIDPLDGTLPYVEGRSGYAVAIALIRKDGIPIIAVIYKPDDHSCYSAIKGHGVWHNGEVFLKPAPKKDFRIFHHRSLLKYHDCDKVLSSHKDTFKAQGFTSIECIYHGGAVMNAIWAIENSPSFYFALPKASQGGGCIWDYAATVCLYNELGYKVTDYAGNPLMLNNPKTIYMNEFGVRYFTGR